MVEALGLVLRIFTWQDLSRYDDDDSDYEDDIISRLELILVHLNAYSDPLVFIFLPIFK